MVIHIEKHIFKLLKHYDCVIITGFGGFILNNRPAYLNSITNKIYPPSKKISFNKNITENDGLLANYISHLENISYEEACIEILKFSRKSSLKLKRGEKLFFTNIGHLNLNDNNQIEFTLNSEINFNQDSYGLSGFLLPEETQNINYSTAQYASVAASIILLICVSLFSLNNNLAFDTQFLSLSPINKNTYSPRDINISKESVYGKETPGIYNVQVSQVDFDLYKINGTNYHISTKKCFKLGFGRDVQIKIWRDEKDRIKREICFLNVSETEYDDCYKIENVYSQLKSKENNTIMVITKRGRMKEAMLVLEKTYIDPYIIANSNPDEITNNKNTNEDSLDITNIGTRFVDAIQSLNSPIKVENTPINTLPKTQSNKKIHIIAGSFSNNKNAQAFKSQLKKRGFEQAEIIGMNNTGLTRVAVNSFFTEEEAEQELLEIKNKLSSAWVLNLNE